jgi:hypothetical protein
MVNQLFHDVHEAPGAGQAGMHVKRHLVAPSRMSEKYAGISGECMASTYAAGLVPDQPDLLAQRNCGSLFMFAAGVKSHDESQFHCAHPSAFASRAVSAPYADDGECVCERILLHFPLV